MLKKFPQDKIILKTKNGLLTIQKCTFFLSRVLTHHSFAFNLRFSFASALCFFIFHEIWRHMRLYFTMFFSDFISFGPKLQVYNFIYMALYFS